MSLILDALRKADRERQQQQTDVPGIDAAHSLAPAPAKKPWQWLALTLLLSLLLAAVIWLLLERSDVKAVKQNAAVANSAHRVDASAVAIGTQPLPESKVAAPKPHKIDTNAKPEQANDPLPKLDTTINSAKKAAEPPSHKAIVHDDEVARLYRQPAPEELSTPVAPRPSVAAVTATVKPKAVQNEPPRSSLLAAYPEVGTIRDLPLALQNSIPTLMYGAHKYRQDGESEVVINNQSLRQGQRLGELSLELIVEDGVIMRKGEHRFRLKAMSSWVNM